MNINLAVVDAPTVTADQLELIKKTIANGATADELKLYLYDCARQRVHPLDKLIHFTKRGGKYTPITSIDLMRTRAAETGDYAGNDDATFDASGNPPVAASVTVYRIVQGQRCAFTATARWAEYFPGEQQGHMWKKMPHTMLAKCAEALALRKAFPKQLAGLYAKEEMDQAGPEPVVLAQAPPPDVEPKTGEVVPGRVRPDAPPGSVFIESITQVQTRNANLTKKALTLSDGRVVTTIKEAHISLAMQCAETGAPVSIVTKPTKWGEDLVSLRLATAPAPRDEASQLPELADDDIPF